MTFWRLLLSCLFLIFVILPGSNLVSFDGLPLTPPEILIAGLVLVTIWTTPRPSSGRARKIVIGLLIFLISLQIVGALTLPTGWSICVKRTVNEKTLTTPCEPSSQFRSGIRSFVYPRVNFIGDNFPVHFLNELAFNYYSEDQPERSTLPFYFSASAYFYPSKNTPITISSNTANTTAILDGVAHEVIIDHPLTLEMTAHSTHTISVNFTAPNSQANILKASTASLPFYRLIAGGVPGQWWAWIFRFVYIAAATICLALMVVRLLGTYLRLALNHQTRVWLMVAIVGMSTMSGNTSVSLYSFAVVVLVLAGAIATHKDRSFLRWLTIFSLLVVTVSYVSINHPYDKVTILGGGNDPLTHESMSRAVMKAQTLSIFFAAEEPSMTFYYQPLYRYLNAAVHQFLGDSLWAPYTAQTYFLGLAYLALVMLLVDLRGPAWLPFLCGTAVFVFFSRFDPSPPLLSMSTYQESLSLPIFAFALIRSIYLFLGRRNIWQLFSCGLLWGLALWIRTDLVPAGLALVPILMGLWFIYPWRGWLARCAVFLGGFSIPPLFVLFRNIIAAGKVSFFTHSAYVNLIDPIKTLIPNQNSAGIFSLLKAILSLAISQPDRLFSIVSGNSGSFMGLFFPFQVEWLMFLLLLLPLLIWGKLLGRVVAGMLFFALATPAIFSTLFVQDNPLGIGSHYSFMLALTLFIELAVLYQTVTRILASKHAKLLI